MTTTITRETAEALVETATYAALYTENLRTKATRQVGVVSGAHAAQMLANSADPRRLSFVLLEV